MLQLYTTSNKGSGQETNRSVNHTEETTDNRKKTHKQTIGESTDPQPYVHANLLPPPDPNSNDKQH